MKNQYTSASPEQKLIILCAEMVTPITIIQGFAAVMRKHYVSSSEKPEEIIYWIDAIEKATDYLRALRDEFA